MLVLFGLLNVSLSLGDEFSNEVYAAEGDTGDSNDGEGKLSVTISGDLEQTTPAVAGETAYRSHNVQVNGTNIDNYTMQISYSSDSNALVNIPLLEGTEPTVIEGANGRTGTSSDDNWWGYAWDSNDKAENTLTFQTMPAYGNGTQLEGGKPENNTVAIDKTLTFAAKFGSDAAAGNYKAGVLLSLAASPKKVVSEGLGSIEYMQDVTPELCVKTPIWTEENLVSFTLKDKRDEKLYTVARIKNKTNDQANCWMTSNLAFDVKNRASKMTTELSDVTTDKQDWANSVTIQNGKYSSTQTLAQYTNSTPTAITNGTYRPIYGYYYSWCAATAGTCSNTTANQPGIRSADMSICPKGWKLPTGGSGGEFADLLGADASNQGITVTLHPTSTPYDYLLSGGMFTSGFVSGDSNGYYWSSSSYSNTYAYGLSMDSSTVWPAGSGDRHFGRSVRCVAATAFDEITTMQQMTADVCAKANVGDTATLKDERDGKYYTIAKIKNAVNDEANCWMTSNLAFDVKNRASKMTTELSDVTTDKQDWADGVMVQNDKFLVANAAAQYTNGTPTQVVDNPYQSTYGYYYSWCAATAGTCSNTTADQPGIRSADMSICPKGWKLPTGGNGGQFADLFGADASSKGITVTPRATAAPYNYLLSGAMNSNGLVAGGMNGRYWSSSSNSDIFAYVLAMDSSKVWPANNDGRWAGRSVRCVAKP